MDFAKLGLHARAVGRLVWRPIVSKGWLHWLRFTALLAVGSYLGHWLSDSPRFADIRYELYQKQVRLQRRGPIYPRHTVLVLLNDDDYWSEDFQARSPLKLEKMAELLDKLNAAGANTVGFDVFMSSPKADKPDYDFPDYAKGDAAFFDSVTKMCAAGRHVVLTTYLVDAKVPEKSLFRQMWDAVVSFVKNSKDSDKYNEAASIYTSKVPGPPCVTVGYDRFSDDMRKIPGVSELENGKEMDSFSLAMVKIVDPIAYANLVNDESNKGFRFAQYLTRSDFEQKAQRGFILNGVAVRTMDPMALRQAVADKIVIVGGNWSAYGYGLGDAVDEHNSPGGMEPGAMLHANYVEAELDENSTFTPISDRKAEMLEWSLAFLLALIAASEIPAGWKAWSVFFAFLLSTILTYVLMQNLGLFLDFLVPFLMVVGHTLTEELLEMRQELRHLKHKLKEHAQ